MGFGFERMPKIFVGDTATLTAYLYDDENETPIPEDDLIDVRFTVVGPLDDPSAPSIVSDEGDITGDGTGVYTVAGSVNQAPGNYRAVARFTYVEGDTERTKTVPVEYDCVDAFARTENTPADQSVDSAWRKLEDCFDSDQGGPWLKDMTMAQFDRDKLKDFLPEVFLEVNAQMPQTTWSTNNFDWTSHDGSAIISLGLLCAAIRHLMRSYTEQPDIMNSQVGYNDRRRYQQAWAAIYQIEQPRYADLLKLYKASQWNTGASMLIQSKAGRFTSGAMRTRYGGRGSY
jgi:hypothetical protein